MTVAMLTKTKKKERKQLKSGKWQTRQTLRLPHAGYGLDNPDALSSVRLTNRRIIDSTYVYYLNQSYNANC